MKRTLLSFLFILMSVLLCAAQAAQAQDQDQDRKRIKVFRVGAPPRSAEVTGLGTVRCFKSMELGFAERGILSQILVEEGDQVKKGQVLARLDDRVLKSDIEAKKAQLKAARFKVEHLTDKKKGKEELYRRKAVSLSEMKDAAHLLRQAQAEEKLVMAELEGLLTKLKTTVLRSPISGTITQRLAEAGEVVGPGEGEVLELMSCRKLLAEVSFGERLYSRLKAGQPVLITADALPGREFVGKVHGVSPVVDEKDRAFQVKVLLDNPKMALHPGMFVRATLLAGGPGEPLWIPAQAVMAKEGDQAVVQVAAEGKLEKRKVVLGQSKPPMVEVKKGLEPGELVVVQTPTLPDTKEQAPSEGSPGGPGGPPPGGPGGPPPGAPPGAPADSPSSQQEKP